MNIKRYVYFFGILIFVLFLFKTFVNFYIIINNTYMQRMLKYGGFCGDYGYGFVKYINEKYKFENNVAVKNYNDFPSSYSYFYNIKKIISDKYLILVNISDEDLGKYYLRENYSIIERKSQCYLIKSK